LTETLGCKQLYINCAHSIKPLPLATPLCNWVSSRPLAAYSLFELLKVPQAYK